MPDGALEIHRDSDPLIEITHNGPSESTYLIRRRYRFDAVGATVGLYIENATKAHYGIISEVSGDRIRVSWVVGPSGLPLTFTDEELTMASGNVTFDDDFEAWAYGDTAKIYKTGTKGSVISTQWVDLETGQAIRR